MSNSKAKFANSLRKSISNEKNKVTSGTNTTMQTNKIIETKENLAQTITAVAQNSQTPKVVVNKPAATLTVKKNTFSKASPARKTTVTKKTVAKKATAAKVSAAKNPQAKSPLSHKNEEFINKAYSSFNQESEAAKSTYDNSVLNWQHAFNDSYSKILITINEELSNYINNMSTASTMQDITQVNIEYFEKIKKFQNDLFKDASDKYFSLLNSFSAYKK